MEDGGGWDGGREGAGAGAGAGLGVWGARAVGPAGLGSEGVGAGSMCCVLVESGTELVAVADLPSSVNQWSCTVYTRKNPRWRRKGR